ncbi:MAG: ABC transporter substrate-binding protein [Deltaproteobacteria bacterium]|nr:ABC transporter substrate-binding protein [Deltaproteobacteria bacterium]
MVRHEMDERRTGTRLAVAALLLLALVQVPTPARPQEIRLGQVGINLVEIPTYVAMEKGFFAERGLRVNFQHFESDTIIIKAFVAGDIQVAFLGSSAAILASSKGVKLKAFVSGAPVHDYVIVAQTPIKAYPDLPGKNFAVSGVGAISYHLPRVAIRQKGVDPDRINYVAVGTDGARLRALIAKKVDATILHVHNAIRARDYAHLHIMSNLVQELPLFVFIYGIAKPDYLNANPAQAARLVRVMIETSRFVYQNKRETVEVAAKVLKMDEKYLSPTYDLLKEAKVWGVNGGLDDKGYDFTARFLASTGELKQPVPADEFFDRRFVSQALRELGTWP